MIPRKHEMPLEQRSWIELADPSKAMEAEDSNMVGLQSEAGCMPVEGGHNVVDMRIWGPEIRVAYMGLYVEASTCADTEGEVSRMM